MMTKTSSVTFEIDKGHRLYKYCDRLTRAAGALWNAALFRVMNGTSMCGKRESVMTPSERSVWTELTAALPAIRNEPWFLISSAMFLDSAFMNAFLPATGCEEYLFPFLPRSSARCVVKEACAAVRNYQKAVETYGKSRKKTSVKPRPPKAAKHEGRRAVVIHRDECGFVLRKKRDGTLVCSVGLPLAKLKRRFDISGADVRGELS